VDRRISLVTLGVDDLARARAFYAALGWHGQQVEETVFVQAGPMALVLWDRGKLAADSGVPDRGSGFDGITLAQNVRSTDEVDVIVAAAADAGATVTRAPAPTFYGGYAGVFLDPDGHAWEIAFNPGFTLDDDGALVLPEFPSEP
jgi:predicted lactoylglutathione lyase